MSTGRDDGCVETEVVRQPLVSMGLSPSVLEYHSPRVQLVDLLACCCWSSYWARRRRVCRKETYPEGMESVLPPLIWWVTFSRSPVIKTHAGQHTAHTCVFFSFFLSFFYDYFLLFFWHDLKMKSMTKRKWNDGEKTIEQLQQLLLSLFLYFGCCCWSEKYKILTLVPQC